MDRRQLLCATVSAALFAGQGAFAQNSPERPLALILIGASWCPFCKGAAMALEAAAVPAGIGVLVASHDGRAIEPFPEFVDARAHPIAVQYQRLPTTLVVHLRSDTVVAEIDGYRNPADYLRKIRTSLVAATEAGYV